MKASPDNDLEFILTDCLDHVLSGQQTVTECLDRFPEYADELRPLLLTGILTARLRSPEMPAEHVDQLEARLRAQMTAQRRVIYLPALRLAVGRSAAIIVFIFMAFLGSSAGLVAASAQTIPGDTLYGVKRFWEEVILIVTTLIGSLDDLWLHFAQVRLEEVVSLSQQGRLTPVAFTELYRATVHAGQSVKPQDQAKMTAFMNQALVALTALPHPQETEAVFQDVVALMRPVWDNQNRLQIPQDDQPPSLAGTLDVVATPLPPPTVAVTNTVFFVSTLTETPTTFFSATPTDTATATWTPRFPATATRTPTPTLSPTLTLTPTPTPTASWTPLPLPQLPPGSGATVTPQSVPSGQPTPVTPPLVVTLGGTAPVRETQQSVYLTQTAGPDDFITATPSP